MTTELTEAQRHQRLKQAREAITKALRETHHEWHRLNDGDWHLLGDIAIDALGDVAAEILTDGTMMRALTIQNGVATLELEPATEILKIFVASMRGVLDGYGAENYLETDMQAPSVSMDLRDGNNPMDSYTVTIQRRTRPTPHEFRQRAEKQRDDILRIVSGWVCESNDTGGIDAGDLTWRLEQAGYQLPEPEEEP
ncbi:hypothetical protein [Streptomyces sp. YIM S03343]